MKSIAGVVATALLAAGLLAAPAEAAPYTPTIKSKCSISVAKAGKKITVKPVVSVNGQGTVKATRTVTVVNAKGKKVASAKLSASKKSVTFKITKKGKYTVKLSGKPASTKYKSCSASKGFRR